MDVLQDGVQVAGRGTFVMQEVDLAELKLHTEVLCPCGCAVKDILHTGTADLHSYTL